MKKDLLGRFSVWVATNKLKAFLITLTITIVMTIGAGMVKMEMSFLSIFPDNTQKFQDLNKIMNEFPFGSAVTIVLDSEGIEDEEDARLRLIKTAEEITAELKMSDYVGNVLEKGDIDLIKNHGLILTETKDINRLVQIYQNRGLTSFIRGLNDDFEKEYSGNEDNLRDDQGIVSNQFKSLEEILILINRSLRGEEVDNTSIVLALDNYLYGEEYFFNKDNTQLLLYVLPTFKVEELDIVVPGVNFIEERTLAIAQKNGINAGLTGLMTVTRDEMVTSSYGFIISMILAVVFILSILIIILKMKSVPFVIGLPLFTGLIWTMGITGFLVGRLNLVTAMYMIALFGLGVDYAIHLLTNFTIEKENGRSFLQALEITYRETGKGVITGALTTAVAFFALLISETRFLKELGLIAGLGILCVLLSTLLIIPLLLSIREKRSNTDRKVMVKASIASGLGGWITRHFKLVIGATLILVTALAFKTNDVQIMDNLMEMEAKGLTSVRLQDEMIEEFEMAPDPLMVISTSLEEAKELSKRLKKLSTVKEVESIAPYLLTEEEYFEREELLNNFIEELSQGEIQNNRDQLLEELYRLEANLLELSELSYIGGMLKVTNSLNTITGVDNNNEKYKESIFDLLFSYLEEKEPGEDFLEFELQFDTILREKLTQMANPERVTIDMLPSNFTDAFISRDGKEYLLTITPTNNPWKKEFRDIYQNQIESVTDKATGLVMISDILSTMTSVDGVRTAILSLIIVFILLIIDFRNVKLGLITILPLLLSFICLFALMALTNIKFDFINIVVIPLLIGIGIDDAVHINHRYLIEGEGNMKSVIKHAGSAVLLTSITTTIGFASFIPSPMVGLSNSGKVFAAAITFAFIFSILFYPSLLILVREKLKLNITSWKLRRKK